MNKFFLSLTLLGFAIGGCQRPASVPPRTASRAPALRLVRPEELIIPPDMSGWPRQLPNGQFPHYPPQPRSKGIEARVVTAFVVGENGRPEDRTISILESPAAHREFVTSVCTFLRDGAEFSWGPHGPARALVIVPFVFQLSGVALTEMLPPEPNLRALRDSIRDMPPGQLAAWVESKQHCV